MNKEEIKEFVESMEVNKKYPLEGHVFDSVEIQRDKNVYYILFWKGWRREWVSGRSEFSVKEWKKESSCKKALEKLIIKGQRK